MNSKDITDFYNRLPSKEEMEYIEFHNERYNEIPPALKNTIGYLLDTHLNEIGIRRQIVRSYMTYGGQWIHKDIQFGHFSFGMYIRNLLRKNGVKDEMFPSHNLDDYYVQLVEWAVGIRE